ncbi:coiled-coil domain-containing protein 15 isoform X1 [Oryctolagus cuniculus]|uniref:coiled-coil domain-containing protein 15 isoform X1 n=1 Tax=Oryctolagus cuniculus TaxID=9986 RepID=UPI003879A554
MPGGMAPLKKPPNSTRLPLALNPQKSKDVLAVLAERNQTIVPVGAWVEPASPDSSEIPAYTSACMIEEELKEQQRKKQEALKRFQRQVKCRVNQQIRLRKKQQLQKSYEAAEKEGCIAMQSSNTAHFTSKRTSVFPKKLNAAVGSPRLPRSQMLGDGIEDGENENELFQQQAQALSQTMKLARQRLASFKTVTKEKASVFTDDKRKSILTQESCVAEQGGDILRNRALSRKPAFIRINIGRGEFSFKGHQDLLTTVHYENYMEDQELDYEEISSVVTNEEGGDLFQGDQQDLLSEDNDVCFSKVQKVKFKSPLFVVMEGEEQTPSYLQGFQHILPEAQDHLPEAQGDLPESQSDLTDVHSVDLEAQSVEPSAQAVEFQVQAVELECQTVELEGQDIQTDTQNSMMKAQSVELEDESTELEAQNFLPPNQAFLPKDQNTLPGYQDQDFVHVREDRDILPEDHNVLPNCQDQDFLPKEDLLPKKLCVLPRDENILKCQNQDFLPKDRSVFSKGQDILHKCPDKDFLPRDQCVLPEEQTILPNYQDQDFLPKDQNFPFRDQHVLPNNQNIPSNYQDQNFLPKDQNILPKDYHVLPKDQTFLSRWQDQDFLSEDQHFPFRDQHVLPDNQNIPSNDQDQDFLLEDQNTLPKGQKQGFLPKYQKVRFKEPYSDMTNEEGREDFSLMDYQYQSPKLQIQDVIRDQNMFPKQPSYFMREEKVREELPLGYHQHVPPKVQQQASLREQNKYIKQPSSFEKWEIAREIVSGVPLSLSFRQQPSVGTAERWREDLPLDSHQHLPSRTQRDASSRRQVYNQSRSSTEFRAPLAFQSGVDQEEDKKERQKQYLRHRRLFMDIEREQVKQQQRQKEQKKKIEKIKKKKEQERYAEEQRVLRENLHKEPCSGEKMSEKLAQLQLEEKKGAREKQQQREKEYLRYVEALRAQIQEKMRLYNITLPPLCCCGPDFWDAHPDTCANNCIFYKNHRAYNRALHSVINSCDISEGNSTLRIAIHNFASAHRRTLKNL